MIDTEANGPAGPGPKKEARRAGFRIWGAVVLAVAAVGAVFAWPARVQPGSAHREEIARAIGSIGFFYGHPRVDAAGSNVLYFQSSEKGVGLFKDDVSTEQRQLIYERETSDYFDCVAFSPDGSLFAWVFNSIRQDGGYISICRSDSGQEIWRAPAVFWHAAEILWLTPDEFVCASWTGDSSFHFMQKEADGKWRVWSSEITATNPSDLTSLSSNTFAWVESGGIHVMDLGANSAVTAFKPKGKQITQFSYSRNLDRYLVTCKEKANFSLWNLQLNPGGKEKFTRLALDNDIHSARWFNHDQGYAYLSEKILVTKNDAESLPARLPLAEVERFQTAHDGRQIFFTGTAGHEPWAGLWRLDMASQTVTNIVPYSEEPSPYAVRSDPLLCTVQAGHRTVEYYLYWPANFDRRKKYRLFIGATPYRASIAMYQRSTHGPNWAQAVAACGAYVAVVNRRSWFEGIDSCATNLMTAYHQLVLDPTIDAGNVFLYAASAETTRVSKLVEEHPELWKGVVLLSPAGLPDLSSMDSASRRPKILLNVGSEEHVDRCNQYQQDAQDHKIEVQIDDVPHAGTFLTAIESVRARTCSVVDFVFGDNLKPAAGQNSQ